MAKKGQELNIYAWAYTGATLFGAYLFLAALFASANIQTLWFSNQAFTLLASIYPGLTATAIGAIIGLVWGLICGAICGGLFSGVHNLMLKKCPWVK